jgi:hypothetical protein
MVGGTTLSTEAELKNGELPGHLRLLNTILGPVQGHPSTWTSPW